MPKFKVKDRTKLKSLMQAAGIRQVFNTACTLYKGLLIKDSRLYMFTELNILFLTFSSITFLTKPVKQIFYYHYKHLLYSLNYHVLLIH